MAKYKTFRKEKWIYLALSITFYFLPFIVVTACLLPMVRATSGLKIAMGLGIVFINAIPFFMGIFKSFFAHFPMLNVLALVFLCLAAFFSLEVFKNCVDKLLWIEGSAALGSLISCILWGKYLKYKKWSESVKATVNSGAFVLKEDNDD